MYFSPAINCRFLFIDLSELETCIVAVIFVVESLQLLKAHVDYKERVKLQSSSDLIAESTGVVNPRSVVTSLHSA